jgi:DNA-binding NtrC family response regulator
MGPILIADDDDEMRHLLEVVLAHAGLPVDSAASGTQLLARLDELSRAQVTPAMVVSDVHMPGATGLDALERIRATMPQVPVILITAFGDPATHDRARELGALAVFNKPFPLQLLRETIVKQLDRDPALVEVRDPRRDDERCA